LNPRIAALALVGPRAHLWADGHYIARAALPGGEPAQPVPVRLFRKTMPAMQDVGGFAMPARTVETTIKLDRTQFPLPPQAPDQFTLQGPGGLEWWQVQNTEATRVDGNQSWLVPVEPVEGTEL